MLRPERRWGSRHTASEIPPKSPPLCREAELATYAPTARRCFRRGGRVVDRTALEMRSTGNRIGGSNPSPLRAVPHVVIKLPGLSGGRKKICLSYERLSAST